jgi:hypothetical protein
MHMHSLSLSLSLNSFAAVLYGCEKASYAEEITNYKCFKKKSSEKYMDIRGTKSVKES